MTRARLAALVAGATALVLTGCGATVVGGGSGGDLPVLHVGARSAAAAKDASGAGAGTDRYPLVGTLPAGPASAPVYRLGSEPVPAATVTALAASLGLSGSAVRHAHGVEVSGSAGTLRVRDGGAWSFWRADDLCPPTRVDVDAADPIAVAVGCAIAEPGTPSPKPAPPQDPATTAAPVLGAAGTGPASAHVVEQGEWSDVVVAARVGGTDVVGLDTVVRVDARGVRAGYGTVGAPAEGPAYPLVSAADALEALRSSPAPEIAIACAIGQDCPGIGPHRVTGASLGLMAAYDGGEQVLVPAWLFAIEGSDTPAAVVAVADRYLADPQPVGGSGGSGGSAVPPVSAEPGSPGAGPTDPGLSPEPVPSASDLPLASYAVTSYSVASDGRTLTVRTEGGICTAYRAEATESADQVRVLITGTPTNGPDQACPAIAKVVEEQVVLDAPLGDRTVVDAGSGAAVPRA